MKEITGIHNKLNSQSSNGERILLGQENEHTDSIDEEFEFEEICTKEVPKNEDVQIDVAKGLPFIQFVNIFSLLTKEDSAFFIPGDRTQFETHHTYEHSTHDAYVFTPNENFHMVHGVSGHSEQIEALLRQVKGLAEANGKDKSFIMAYRETRENLLLRSRHFTCVQIAYKASEQSYSTYIIDSLYDSFYTKLLGWFFSGDTCLGQQLKTVFGEGSSLHRVFLGKQVLGSQLCAGYTLNSMMVAAKSADFLDTEEKLKGVFSGECTLTDALISEINVQVGSGLSISREDSTV